MTVTSLAYDPINPIDDVFDAVQDVADLAQVAGAPYTVQQIVNMAYVIVNNTRKFGKWITEWNRIPPAQRDWINFKEFFRTAHAELLETTDLTAQETPYQANLVQEIVQGLKNEFRDMSAASSYANHLSEASESEEISSLHDEIQSLKSTISQLQHQMVSHANTTRYSPPPTYVQSPLQGVYHTSTQQVPSPTDATLATDISGMTSSKNDSTTRQEPGPAPSPKKVWYYCWTHGVCGHTGSKCFRKAQGHIDNATFNNTCGGSVKGLKRYNRTHKK